MKARLSSSGFWPWRRPRPQRFHRARPEPVRRDQTGLIVILSWVAILALSLFLMWGLRP